MLSVSDLCYCRPTYTIMHMLIIINHHNHINPYPFWLKPSFDSYDVASLLVHQSMELDVLDQLDEDEDLAPGAGPVVPAVDGHDPQLQLAVQAAEDADDDDDDLNQLAAMAAPQPHRSYPLLRKWIRDYAVLVLAPCDVNMSLLWCVRQYFFYTQP